MVINAKDFPSVLNNVELIPMRLLRERLRPKLFGGDHQWPKVHIIRDAVLQMIKKKKRQKLRQQQQAANQLAKNEEHDPRRLLEQPSMSSKIVGKDEFQWDHELLMMLHRRDLTLHEVDTEAFKAMQNEYLELRREKQSENALKQMQQDWLDNTQKQQERMEKAMSRHLQLSLRLSSLSLSSRKPPEVPVRSPSTLMQTNQIRLVL
ncbi:hypothetical protein CYMTET_53353 [Cymbomonas tetramitiformis]|uniref:Uncharacterized protein n=1 Tax=Cymbomonas tetramitiformis TaxID=36881 RepID=A0AAE0BH34_9CHLO|nr:hypothetical protein CYMTET_53353 [Cymbomonas tetramitiformis]